MGERGVRAVEDFLPLVAVPFNEPRMGLPLAIVIVAGEESG